MSARGMLLNLWGRERESLEVRQMRAVRAKYMGGPGLDEVEVHLRVETGQRLDLHIPSALVPELIGQLTDAYEAINPPLSRRSNRAASWAEDQA